MDYLGNSFTERNDEQFERVSADDVFAIQAAGSIESAAAVEPTKEVKGGGASGPPLPLSDPAPASPEPADEADGVFTPAPAANPVVAALRQAGLHLESLGAGRHRITCPWAGEHGASASPEAVYVEPDRTHPIGQFRCVHAHAERPDTVRLVEHLGLTTGAARAKPRIRVAPGDIHLTVDAAERLLAADGTYFQSGGPIVRVAVDAVNGSVSSELVNDQTLISVLSEQIEWEKADRIRGWVRCDPPGNVVQALLKGQIRRHLPKLSGLARQPFYRADGTLVTTPGYDPGSGIYAAFHAADYALPEPTRDAAEESLHYLKWLVREFHFASDADRSAAICAMLTAAVRPSLPLAPAFSISASSSGSGKSYLASLIVPFAGPGEPHNVSFPATAEEATKVVLAMLLERPPAILFDDMQGDWKPFGALNKALTSPEITERLLGSSRTAHARTNVLVLGTGNNIEPERDMRRRVVSIYLAPPAGPATLIKYGDDPAGRVRGARAYAVKAALTIIAAYKAAGQPAADVPTIGSFPEWSAMCRRPLIWLGEPDPATSLIEQVTHDPDVERLGELMREWVQNFGFGAVTVRKVVDKACDGSDLLDILSELPVMSGSKVNPGSLGWFLKKNRGRIVDGYRIESATCSERRAWKVVAV